MRKNTKEEFVVRAHDVHGMVYDYSQVEYINMTSKVRILCPMHGTFEMRPSDHLKGQKCKQCARLSMKEKLSKTTEEFVTEASIIHKGAYVYSNVEYVNSHTNVTIICNVHGPFGCRPSNHLQGVGCPTCKKQKISNKNASTTEQFILKSTRVHDQKYDYSQVCYVNNTTPVMIGCKIHGTFIQRPDVHVRGGGCKKCSNDKNKNNPGRYTTDNFNQISELNTLPGTLYLVKLERENETLLKVGITKHASASTRMHSPYTFKGYKYTILHESHMTLYDAYKTEQLIKKEFKKMKKTPQEKFDGYTECFEWSNALETMLGDYMR